MSILPRTVKSPRFLCYLEANKLVWHSLMGPAKSRGTHRSEAKDFISQEPSVGRLSAFSCFTSASLIPKGQRKEN